MWKSIIYQGLPIVYDFVCIVPGPGRIVIVILPLLALIQDKMANLRKIGVGANFIMSFIAS